MSAEANKNVVRHLVAEFWNQGNANVFDEVFADNFIDHTPQPGSDGTKEGFRQVALGMRMAFSDGHNPADDLVADGDTIAWRWTFRGNHTGPLMGIPATGKPVSLSGISIDRFANGQIVERWSQADNLGLLQQLGVIPAPQ
jgi:steroid delta-isomerase-like uncharacterized protein